jgi:DNA-directed RNA polymerase subunit RPC12/RpoP
MKPKCPGQDLRYWKLDAIYTVPCPVCGQPVEFFKDDRSRKCPHCRKRFKNPRLDLSCAKWCVYAKECIDYRGE